MAKNWSLYPDYDPFAFGLLVKEARLSLKSLDGTWTLEKQAKLGGIDSKATMKHIEEGRPIPAEKRKRLIDILVTALERSHMEMNRRELLKAGLVAFLVGSVAGTAPLHWKKQEILSDFVPNATDRLIECWRKLLYEGNSEFVLCEAESHYAEMISIPWVTTDVDTAISAGRVALVVARAKEVSKTWHESCFEAVQTYDDAELRIFKPALERFARDQGLANEYAKLLDARARMLRRIGKFEKSILDAEKIIKYASASDDDHLQIDIYFKLAHTWACLGMRKEWLKTLEDAQKAIENSRRVNKDEHKTYLTYYIGEGLKRFVYNPYVTLSKREITHLAEMGLAKLSLAREQVGKQWQDREISHETVGYHPLYTRLGEIQCQLWLDPKGARDRLNTLAEISEQNFPALLGKVGLTHKFIDSIEGWNQHTPLPVFDLDAITRPVTSDARLVRSNHGYSP